MAPVDPDHTEELTMTDTPTTAAELFLITAATGKTGTHTVRFLLAQGHRVRALVHRHDERSQRLRDLGADVVEGDMLDFAAVSAAMVGITGAYFCYPIHPGHLLEATTIFAQAATEAGIRNVVNMSQISARREAVSHAAQHHWLAERLLDRTTLMTTHLRPTFFAEWLTWYWVRNRDGGVLRLPFGNGRHAPIAAVDQARLIAAILPNPRPHDHQIYPLHGPEELDHDAIAAKMQQVLGYPVRYEPIEIPQFARALSAHGATDFLVQHLGSVAVDYRNGIFAGTNNLIEVITGTAPLTVEDFTAGVRDQLSSSGPFGVLDELIDHHAPLSR
jgi:NAD(P)H dehydrogenase (quinone)